MKKAQRHIHLFIISILLLVLPACGDIEIQPLSLKQQAVIKTIPSVSVIAHRGTTIWAPEHTEAAMRWARNIGATYLECDLQRTADGYLVLFHDDTLSVKSNICQLYHTSDSQISHYTLKELWAGDFGSWYNLQNPQLSRQSFCKLDIITLEDLIMIAEGYRIKRDSLNRRVYREENNRLITEYEIDPADNGNRPGIYPEIKYPEKYPGIEQDLKNELERLGWYATNSSELKKIPVRPRCVQTANSTARVIVQTFSTETLQHLTTAFPRLIPFTYLISASNGEKIKEKQYKKWINQAINNQACILAPCIPTENFRFTDLLQPWMYDLIQESGLKIHAYTFTDLDQIQYYEDRIDGVFCNQSEIALEYFSKSGNNSTSNYPLDPETALEELGYYK